MQRRAERERVREARRQKITAVARWYGLTYDQFVGNLWRVYQAKDRRWLAEEATDIELHQLGGKVSYLLTHPGSRYVKPEDRKYE